MTNSSRLLPAFRLRLPGYGGQVGRPPRLQGGLGFRSLRAVGQRYRIIYSIDAEHARVHVVAAGLRRQGARDDIYELAQRLVRLGLAPAPARSKSAGRARRRPKKK